MKEIRKTRHISQPTGATQELPYLVPDLLRDGLKLVLCGTAPSTISAAKKAYYANPGNRFWRIMAESGLTPHQLAPQDYPQLSNYDIGLTDLCKTVSGNDDQLPGHAIDPAALRAKIERYQPRVLAFTSKQGAKWFLVRGKVELGLQAEIIGSTRLFVLPSTSPLARRYWPESQHHWHELATLVNGL